MSLIKQIESAIKTSISSLGYDVKTVSLLPSNRPDLGDYQINEAMMLGKKYGKNPRDIASDIVNKLEETKMFKEISIAGPGFINLKLSDDLLVGFVNDLDDVKNNLDYPKKQKILIDYGGANVAKELHVGHLRSANIGEALKRLAKLLGNDVIADVHLGDFGLPLGLVEKELKEEQPDLIYFDKSYTGPYPKESPVTPSELARIYPLASLKKKEDEDYLKDAQEITTKIQNKVPGYYALWKHIVETSKISIKEVYDELNTNFDLWLGESDADASSKTVIDIFEKEGLTRRSEGAIVVDVKKPDDNKEVPPVLLVKSNDSIGYQTTELATLYNRMRDYDLDAVWYLTDARQSLHFLQCFRAAKMSGIVKENVSLEHLPFGTINGPDGKPFKTRDGGVMPLQGLIDLVYDVTLKKINTDIVGTKNASLTAKMIAVDTVKYADLLPDRTTDYVFDPEKFSDLEGKTAPYLLYSTIRIRSLINKAKEAGISFKKYHKLTTNTEKDIIMLLLELPRVLLKSYNQRSLNDMAEYLYKLTSCYNKFYAENKILTCSDDTSKESYLFLSNVVLKVNEMILDTLGLKIPEKM